MKQPGEQHFTILSDFTLTVLLDRIEYDAYRSDLEMLQNSTTSQAPALVEAQLAHDQHKAEFEKLRADVLVKLRFLNENRVKVRHASFPSKITIILVIW